MLSPPRDDRGGVTVEAAFAVAALVVVAVLGVGGADADQLTQLVGGGAGCVGLPPPLSTLGAHAGMWRDTILIERRSPRNGA